MMFKFKHNLNIAFMVVMALIVTAVFARTGFVQSELTALTQGTWTEMDEGSATELPAEDWAGYSAKDPGIVAGDDLHLEEAGYLITQTSDDGLTDTCDTDNCSPGDGFNGSSAVKTGTTVTGSGSSAGIKLTVAPITDEFDLNALGSLDTDDAQGLYVNGNTVYIADNSAGLRIIDITDPASPSLTGTYDTSDSALGVFVEGDYAYVADDKSGLHIIDISTPASPTLTGTYNTSGRAKDVAVSGDYAYVADDTSGLAVIDISTPASPALTGTYNTSGKATGIAISGIYAYVADDTAGLQIIDISTPAAPALVGTYNTSGKAIDVTVSGNYAYVADDNAGLEIIDIATPSSPSSAGSLDLDGDALGIALSGNVAYVASGTYGTAAVDVSDPSAPSLLAAYDSTDISYDVAASGNKVYIADGANGLQVIQSSQSSSYYAAGTFESDVMDLGSDNFKIGALIADFTTPYDIHPVGMEIPASDDGLLALWRMNTSDTSENSLADSAGSNDGALHATPAGTNTSKSDMWDASGNLGTDDYTALEFDGTDDYVSINNTVTGIKTVMFWINHSSPTAGDVIMEFNGSQSISIEASSGDIITTGITSPAIYVDGSAASAALSTGWHHVTVVTSTSITGTNINLGRVVTGYMTGLLDEVALYSTEISANRIHKAYMGTGIRFRIAASSCENGAENSSCTSNAGWGDSGTPFIGSDGTDTSYLDGPAALYHFDEGSGSTLEDHSGYGHNAAVVIGGGGSQAANAAAWSNGAFEPLSELGSQALSFDGTDDYVSAGDLEADIKSVEFWINHGSNAYGGVILELNATHSVVISLSGDIVASGFSSPTIYIDGSAASAALSSGWHHVAVITDSAVTASNVMIGRVGDQYMAGSLDEMAFYDRTLSEAEVKARYNDGSGKTGALFGGIASSSLDNKRYIKYKASLVSASMAASPELHDVTVAYFALPQGAGLVSSVFDAGDTNAFITDIAWSETLDGHDVRVQLATSNDGEDWYYCGMFDCSDSDWLDFAGSIGNYYSKSSGSTPNYQSRNVDNDRYFQYKIWLMSDDGVGTPSVEDITVSYDVAHMEVMAPDGVSGTYTARIADPFDIVLLVKDSAGETINHHDGSRTVKLVSSVSLSDTETCTTTFTKNGKTEFTRSVVFFSGRAAVSNVILCDASKGGAFTISAKEVVGGALESTADLTITDVREPDDTVSKTLYWDPLDDCAGFDHYEVWYGLTSNVEMGIGIEWDDSDDEAMAVCSTSTTTITDLQAYTKYYFVLYAVDENGNAVILGVSDSEITDEEVSDEDLIESIDEALPEGSKLYDVVIKLGDHNHPDPAEDSRASWKHGDVITVVLNGHQWTDNEKRSFLIVQMALTDEEKADLLMSEVTEDGALIKRRTNKLEMEALGLSANDAKDRIKRKAVRDELHGKRLNKDKAVKAKMPKKAKKDK